MPRSRLSRVSRSRWSRMSSSRESRARRRRIMTSLLLRGRAEDPPDGRGQRVPLARLDRELLPALRGQPVELGPPVVLGGAVIEVDPATLDQAVEGRVQRSLLHQQDVVRALFDRLRNRMAVRRSPPQRAQDEEVEGALQELDAAP